MARKELIEYIRKVRKQGHSDKAIQDHLRKYGYKEEAIKEAYSGLDRRLDQLLVLMGVLVGIGAIFAVALVIMNIMDAAGTSASCDNTSISLFTWQDQSIVCNRFEGRLNLQIPVENTGTNMIRDIEVKLIGEDGTSVSLDRNVSLYPKEIFPKGANHNESEDGLLKQVIITPSSPEGSMCKDKSITIDEINC